MEIKLKKYDTYKDSGVEWLGEIPESWEVKPGFTILRESKEKNKGFIEKTILSLSYGKVIIKPEEKLTGLVPESFETYQLVTPGDIIIRPTDLQNDVTSLRTGFAKNKGIITSAYINLRVSEKFSNVFYHYYLHTIDINKIIYGLGSGLRQNISFLDFKRFPFPLPSVKEQTSIAKFLDDKTAKIEQAISIKEKQIGLLKERRQILIHKAVTQGINPNVKLKDSGIEWIGEIPEHWDLSRLKYIFKIVKKIAGELGHDVLSITQRGIKIKDIESNEGQLSMDYSKYQIVTKGDFAMNHMDLLTGYVDISKYNGVMSPDYRVFNLINPECNEEYMLLLLQLGYKSKVFYAHGQGVSLLGRWRFPADNFNNFYFPIPPKSEQMEIVNFIENTTNKIEKAVTLKEQEIEKLKEYKASLINSVVTGKVRVN